MSAELVQAGGPPCTWRRRCGAPSAARVERRTMLAAFADDVCPAHLARARSHGYRVIDTYVPLSEVEVPLPPPR